MSDISQGEGWWQASDHKWYPPEQHPDVKATEPEPEPEPEPQPDPEPEPERPRASLPAIILGVVIGAAVIVGAVLLFSRGSDDDKSISIGSTGSGAVVTLPSVSSSSEPTSEELHSRLLTTPDFGPQFNDDTFSPNTRPTLPCGEPNPDVARRPDVDIGVAVESSDGITIQEELVRYGSEAAAQSAFEALTRGYDCTQGTVVNNADSTQPIQFMTTSAATDLAVQIAIRVDFTTTGLHGQLFVVRIERGIVAFLFSIPDRAGTSGPDAVAIVKRGLSKLG